MISKLFASSSAMHEAAQQSLAKQQADFITTMNRQKQLAEEQARQLEYKHDAAVGIVK